VATAPLITRLLCLEAVASDEMFGPGRAGTIRAHGWSEARDRAVVLEADVVDGLFYYLPDMELFGKLSDVMLWEGLVGVTWRETDEPGICVQEARRWSSRMLGWSGSPVSGLC